jgi:nucleotide-binding universal stress UspA family protein
MKTILVPVDLSDRSNRVCDAACDLAKATNAKLVVLHVVVAPPIVLNTYGFATAELGGMMRELEKRASRQSLALGRRCEKRLGRPVRVIQKTGDPVPVILAKARELKADCVVLGSHGHTAAYDLLVGSTTQKILRRARSPVLVVPMSAKATARR